VIYIFDPHARGYLPVRRYQALADEYGYVLIASNDSKNGLPFDYISRIFSNLQTDGYQRWKINERRQYLLGFSGGARIASQLIKEHPEINGIIGCGAGLSFLQNKAHPFVYAGLAGTQDFNLVEMRQQNEAIESLQPTHLFIEFDGKHDWPPIDDMRTAFDWLEVNAIRQTLVPMNEPKLNSILTRYDNQIREARRQYQLGKMVILYRQLIQMLNNLYDIRDFQESLSELERLLVVHDHFKTRRLMNREEIKKQQLYQDSFTTQTAIWWKAEIKKLKQPPREKPFEEYQLMNQRLLQYVSMLGYINSERALNDNQLDRADQYLAMYYSSDPENPDQRFLKACFWMKKDSVDKAITMLHEAAKLGFADPDKIENESSLAPLKTHNQYLSILNLVRMNSEQKK
jgi:pimeloyl-ACP methyl ester carboxylesterase